MKRDTVYKILIDLGCSPTEAVMRITKEHATRDNYLHEMEIRNALLGME